MAFGPTSGGAAVLGFRTPVTRTLAIVVETLLWLAVAAAAIVGWRLRRPRRREEPELDAASGPVDQPEKLIVGPTVVDTLREVVAHGHGSPGRECRRPQPGHPRRQRFRGALAVSDVEPGGSRPGEPRPGEPPSGERGGRWLGGHRHRVPRLPVVVAVLALLVAGGLIDRQSEAQTKPGGPVVRPMPAAAALAAISSTWFCGGALGQPAKVADGEIVIVNTLGRTLNGTVTFLAAAGSTAGTSPAPATGAAATGDTAAPATVATPFAGQSIPVTVGPRDRLVVPETAAAKAAFVGASVELDGGGAAVQQVVTGAEGIASTACASTGSDHWYFADGTTEEHSNLYLTLADPYSEDAIVDLSFSTEQGQEAPADYQGIVITAGSVVGIDVGAHLRQRVRGDHRGRPSRPGGRLPDPGCDAGAGQRKAPVPSGQAPPQSPTPAHRGRRGSRFCSEARRRGRRGGGPRAPSTTG